jgi:hypothetical protein
MSVYRVSCYVFSPPNLVLLRAAGHGDSSSQTQALHTSHLQESFLFAIFMHQIFESTLHLYLVNFGRITTHPVARERPTGSPKFMLMPNNRRWASMSHSCTILASGRLSESISAHFVKHIACYKKLGRKRERSVTNGNKV